MRLNHHKKPYIQINNQPSNTLIHLSFSGAYPDVEALFSQPCLQNACLSQMMCQTQMLKHFSIMSLSGQVSCT